MLHLSLILNILVLTPLLWALYQATPGMEAAYGPDGPARRILSAVYLAILLISLGLLAAHLWTRVDVVPYVVALLVLQVVYKIATAALLGIGHPVVAANLAISAVHIITLVTLLR